MVDEEPVVFYLIENLMGFERPVRADTLERVETLKAICESSPAVQELGMPPKQFTVEAKYYIVAKKEWDPLNCPLIPVDYA